MVALYLATGDGYTLSGPASVVLGAVADDERDPALGGVRNRQRQKPKEETQRPLPEGTDRFTSLRQGLSSPTPPMFHGSKPPLSK